MAEQSSDGGGGGEIKGKIHAESGLVFSQNDAGGTSWHNPLDTTQQPTLLDPEEREEQVGAQSKRYLFW